MAWFDFSVYAGVVMVKVTHDTECRTVSVSVWKGLWVGGANGSYQCDCVLCHSILYLKVVKMVNFKLCYIHHSVTEAHWGDLERYRNL